MTGAVSGAARKAKGPAIATGAAAAGLAGGLVVRRLLPKRRKVLGVSLPKDGLVPSGGLKPMAKQVSKAGKRVAKASVQLEKLAGDVQRAGKTAQKMGDTLS